MGREADGWMSSWVDEQRGRRVFIPTLKTETSTHKENLVFAHFTCYRPGQTETFPWLNRINAKKVNFSVNGLLFEKILDSGMRIHALVSLIPKFKSIPPTQKLNYDIYSVHSYHPKFNLKTQKHSKKLCGQSKAKPSLQPHHEAESRKSFGLTRS